MLCLHSYVGGLFLALARSLGSFLWMKTRHPVSRKAGPSELAQIGPFVGEETARTLAGNGPDLWLSPSVVDEDEKSLVKGGSMLSQLSQRPWPVGLLSIAYEAGLLLARDGENEKAGIWWDLTGLFEKLVKFEGDPLWTVSKVMLQIGVIFICSHMEAVFTEEKHLTWIRKTLTSRQRANICHFPTKISLVTLLSHNPIVGPFHVGDIYAQDIFNARTHKSKENLIFMIYKGTFG